MWFLEKLNSGVYRFIVISVDKINKFSTKAKNTFLEIPIFLVKMILLRFREQLKPDPICPKRLEIARNISTEIFVNSLLYYIKLGTIV